MYLTFCVALPGSNVKRTGLRTVFEAIVGSTVEQINECFSVNPYIPLDLGHKTNADRFTTMNRHNRTPTIRMLQNRVTPSLPHKLKTDFPQRSDHMSTGHTRHSVHTDIL